MEPENVNKGKWAYFLVSILGMTVFFGMFAFLPETVVAPLSSDTDLSSQLPDFGKPLDRSPSHEPVPSEPSSVRLVFTGDIMLARAVEWAIRAEGPEYPFLRWESGEFLDADAVIGNFEGTIRATENIEQTNVMAFDTLPTSIPALKNAGFTHLSLSNNHSDDFGEEVAEFTRSTIFESGMIPFGDPFASEKFVTRIEGGIPVSIIGFHAFNETAESIFQAIQEEDAAGNFVIVYPHWGNEYEHSPSPAQTSAAQLWIEAGADLIVGAHPHVVQSVDTIDGVPVIYSLGNFLFDQDFSRATQVGAFADVVISDDEISLSFSPVEIRSRQMFINHEENEQLLSWLGLSDLTWNVPREEVQTP
jgi:poly-gamma-glutamate capsule biosynthesis protein CapA/YwtB (metallophosphatase superfamily)